MDEEERKKEENNDSSDSESEDDIEQLQYKIVILGDGAVGKTSINNRFTEDYFARHYKQTIGVGFHNKRVVLPGNVHVTLSIWDIGGQNIGSKMISKYIYGCQAVLLVYDVTNYQSFQNLEDWLELVNKTFAKSEAEAPHIALVANKADLNHLKAVSKDQHDDFADGGNMSNHFMSAKTGDNVNATFFRIAAELAGVVLNRSDLEAKTRIVEAQIVNHQQHDPEQGQLNLQDKKGGCSLM